MLDYARIPFDADTPRENPQFYQFLRPVLAEFCGHSKNLEIWCTIPSARVENRQIRIPKVPQKQIPNSVYWTYQRISPFDDKEKLFDFEILGEVQEGDALKIDVMAYTAPQLEIKELKDLFAKAGFPLTGISIVPFAFQSLLRSQRMTTEEAHISSLYIGRDWSRIDIFSEGSLMLSRGIKAGVKTMIEALRTEIEGNLFELSVAKSSTKDTNRIRAIKKKLKFELEQAQQLFFGTIHDTPQPVQDEQQLVLKEDKIFKMILPALERLVRQVERTLRHFSLNYEKIRLGKIYISSGVNLHKRVVDYISEELDAPTEAVNPFEENANFIALTPVPESIFEQSAYAPAMGMALSSNALTPNFLYTYKDKQHEVRSHRINRSVFAGFLLVMALCIGISFWQDNLIKDKEYRRNQLQQQLEQFTLRVDKNLIIKLVGEANANNRDVKEVGNKYFGVAVVSEITELTPANVRLLSISVQLGNVPGKQKGKKESKPRKTLILNGIVQGNRLTLESTLADYLLELKNSPIFDQPTVNKKTFELFEDEEVLRFTARLKLV
jgi:Tfp pilus assembly PilM family ATPase